jgi:hypothetical protein
LGLLLGALELPFGSWTGTLDVADTNRRACSWYVVVRPDMGHGSAGLGWKGAATRLSEDFGFDAVVFDVNYLGDVIFMSYQRCT